MLATKTVAKIEQTTASALRESVKDGNASPDELKKLSEQAFSDIKKQLSKDTRDLIEVHFGSYAKFIEDTIEQKVLELKRNVGKTS